MLRRIVVQVILFRAAYFFKLVKYAVNVSKNLKKIALIYFKSYKTRTGITVLSKGCEGMIFNALHSNRNLSQPSSPQASHC